MLADGCLLVQVYPWGSYVAVVIVIVVGHVGQLVFVGSVWFEESYREFKLLL